MSKAPAKRSYTVSSQIELDGVTYAKGSKAEMTDEQAASVADCVTLDETIAPAPVAGKAKTE